MRRTTLCLLALLGASLGTAQEDLRARYDVQTYRLDLKIDPAAGTLEGTVWVEAKVLADMDTFELDLRDGWTVTSATVLAGPVTPDGSRLGTATAGIYGNERVKLPLLRTYRKGEQVRVAVSYQGSPATNSTIRGIRFQKTPSGEPWVTSSCQGPGAHAWWPCKGEWYHPEDKFDRIFINATVPKGLTAVSNGRLTKKTESGDWTTFNWRHDYNCENYAVAINVAPYAEWHGTYKVKGLAKPLPYSYYVLPEDLEKAKLEFQVVPKFLQAFGEAFGPFPFPNSKFCLVQTPFWGMEHSTNVAYGNSWPAWLKKTGQKDPRGEFNRFFDYIIIHECGHEWWGNSVSAADWGHLWIHEGFNTYAEGVFVEKTIGRKEAEEWYAQMKPKTDLNFRIFRGKGVTPQQAFNNNVYYKSAQVLNTLRHYVNDDKAWWKTWRTFHMRWRGKSAVTEDFQAVLEEVTGRKWGQWFQEWFYGAGVPALNGTVSAQGKTIVVDVENPPVNGGSFHVPLDVSWKEGTKTITQRVALVPGSNHISIKAKAAPTQLKVVNLHRLVGNHTVTLK